MRHPCRNCQYYMPAIDEDISYCEYWAEDEPQSKCEQYVDDDD